MKNLRRPGVIRGDSRSGNYAEQRMGQGGLRCASKLTLRPAGWDQGDLRCASKDKGQSRAGAVGLLD